MLPSDMQNGVGGRIVQGEGYTPSDKGTVVYLNGGEDLNIPLSRIEKAGAKICYLKLQLGKTDLWLIY